MILDPGRHLSDFVKLTLHGVECVSRPSIAEALKETGAQVCLCGIVLTKIETRSAVSEAIRALSGCFPIVIFYEPCSLNHNRLGAQGLTSFHSHFTSNKMFGVLDMAMFVGALSGCPTCRVVHFGQNLAVDTDAVAGSRQLSKQHASKLPLYSVQIGIPVVGFPGFRVQLVRLLSF